MQTKIHRFVKIALAAAYVYVGASTMVVGVAVISRELKK